MSGMSGPPPPTHCPDHEEALAYLPSLLHSPLWPRNALYLWTCTQDSSQCRCCFWLDKGSCKYTWAEVTQDLLWPNPQHVCVHPDTASVMLRSGDCEITTWTFEQINWFICFPQIPSLTSSTIPLYHGLVRVGCILLSFWRHWQSLHTVMFVDTKGLQDP